MVCNNQPSDKSQLTIGLIVPENVTTVANGEILKTQVLKDERKIVTWEQVIPMPNYTFGFAIGKYQKVSLKTKKLDLNYYSSKNNANQLKIIA